MNRNEKTSTAVLIVGVILLLVTLAFRVRLPLKGDERGNEGRSTCAVCGSLPVSAPSSEQERTIRVSGEKLPGAGGRH